MRNREGGDFTGGDDGNGDTGKDWFANDEVHFIKDSGVQRRARQGRQSVLGCMMGCTRELRVRKCFDYNFIRTILKFIISQLEGSREAMRGCLLTNVPLTLRDAEPRSRGESHEAQYIANNLLFLLLRKPSLVLSRDQSEIHWPTVS